MKSANGVLILILGIASWVGFGCLAGIPAWILGNIAVKDIQEGRADPSELGLVNAGRILGMINTIIVILAGACWIMALMGIGGLAIFGARNG